MVKLNNLANNRNIHISEQKGNIQILEYLQDKSITPENAMQEYFASKMNSRKRQALITLNNDGFIVSSGAMQWIAGDIKAGTDVKGIGDFFGKAIKGAITKESVVKPRYHGSGYLMLEPTYRYLIIEDIGEWREGMVLEDELFLGCQDTITQKLTARKTVSSIVLGKEGLFNLCLTGKGYALLESPVPREELIEIELEDDEIRIDGNFAIAWSDSLRFTVEKSTRTLIGSAVSGEGFVNVYQGSGKVLLAPVETAREDIKPADTTEE